MIAVVQKPTPHYTRGTIPRRVRAAVLHIAEGSESAVDSWFNTPASKVSAHFLVGLDGDLRQYVSVHDVAWHAGRVLRPTWAAIVPGRTNSETVGIEHEGSGRTAWPEAQLTTSVILTAWLCERFGWEPSELTLPMHREIYAGKTCPGPAFDRANYIERVRAVRRLFGADVKRLITGIR